MRAIDVGKPADHELQRKGMNADILADAMELRDIAAAHQENMLFAIGGFQKRFAAGGAFERDDRPETGRRFIADIGRENARIGFPAPEHIRLKCAFFRIGERNKGPSFRRARNGAEAGAR